MFTKKNYVKIAETLKQDLRYYRTHAGGESGVLALESFGHHLCAIFLEDNPRFDFDTFLEASTIVQPHTQF